MDRLRIEAVIGDLPREVNDLRAEALKEGHRHIERLVEDWASGSMRFDRAGELLLAAYLGDALIGIGGVTVDPGAPGLLRMRRFYVSSLYRWHGVGRQLATALIERASSTSPLVTVNAGISGAEHFWEALGFVSDARDGRTHFIARQP